MADALVGYQESDTPTVNLEVNNGDIGGKVPIHDVRQMPALDIATMPDVDIGALPPGVADDIGDMAAFASAIVGHVDGLETLVTATNTKLDTINGHVDQVEAYLLDLGSKLDAIDLTLAPTQSVINQTASGTSSAAFGSQLCGLGFWAKNISTGVQKVYIFSGGTATAANGYELAVGEERFFPCAGGNMSTYRHIASAASANICWEAM